MKVPGFVRYSVIWYSQQFAIPFWVVGHVHLSFANYHLMVKAGTSLLLHAFVAWGFWLDLRSEQAEYDSDTEDPERS